MLPKIKDVWAYVDDRLHLAMERVNVDILSILALTFRSAP